MSRYQISNSFSIRSYTPLIEEHKDESNFYILNLIFMITAEFGQSHTVSRLSRAYIAESPRWIYLMLLTIFRIKKKLSKAMRRCNRIVKLNFAINTNVTVKNFTGKDYHLHVHFPQHHKVRVPICPWSLQSNHPLRRCSASA